jgi:microcystin-dependent protein
MLTPYIGEVSLYAFNFAPRNWVRCDGRLLPLSQNTALFLLIKNVFGGDGVSTFALPDYHALAPQSMQYCIALQGVQPNAAPRPANLGEIALLPYAPPTTWLNCNHQMLQRAQYADLFQIIGTSFGGGGSWFNLPDLRMMPPPFPTGAPATTQPQPSARTRRVSQPAPPSQSLYCISSGGGLAPPPAFQGEVRLMPSWSVPAGWVPCKGQSMPINQNQAMFSLLGTNFGGDGRTSFALPNLSRVAVPTGLQYCISTGGTFPTR